MKLIQQMDFFDVNSPPAISKEYNNYYGSSLIIEASGLSGHDISIEGKILQEIDEWTKLALIDLATMGVVTSITSDGLYALNTDGIRYIRANNGGANGNISLIGRITDTPIATASSGGGGGGTPGKDGKDGKDGSVWYTGTAITGTSTIPTAFNTGISNANVGDLYLNTETGNIYACTTAGNQTNALWAYKTCIMGPSGGVSNIDEKSLQETGSGDNAVIEVAGYGTAQVGTYPVKTAVGLEWKAESKEKTYRFAGSIVFANLPEPSAETEGQWFNIKDGFTTTDKFVDGAGNKYEAGTDIAIVSYVDTSVEPNVTDYVYDVFAAPFDVAAITQGAVDEVADLFKTQMVVDIGSPVIHGIENGTDELRIPFQLFDGIDEAGVIKTLEVYITLPFVNTAEPGIMSASDKAKLDKLTEDTNTTYRLFSVDGISFKLQSHEKGAPDTEWTDVGDPIEITYTLEEGMTNGTLKFNGTEVRVHGLGTAAYEQKEAFDVAGAADAVKGTADDTSANITVYGGRKYTDEKVAAAVSSVYKPGGSVAFADLPTPDAAKVGYVYDISDDFTADDKFKADEVGNKYPAGTNVVLIEVSEGEYKYDVLPGMVDLTDYAKSADVTKEIGDAKVELIGVGDATATTIKGAVQEANTHADTEINALDARVEALEMTASKLSPIAESGNVNDLVQTDGDYIVFDCGTSSTVI